MGRLIDFDVCEKQLTDFYESSLNDHDAMLFVEFMAQLENVPTAYDVEKVIDELDDVLCNEISQPVADAVSYIVRKGGVE